jgi:hypothetical protein
MTINTLAADLPGFWDGSKAQQPLKKEDVKRGRHARYKAGMLCLKWAEYQKFELDAF